MSDEGDGWGEDMNDGGDGADGWGDINDDQQDDGGNDLENTYYQAEATSDPYQAIEKFESAIAFAEGADEYDYRFKSYMWIVYLSAKVGDFDRMESYSTLLLNTTQKVSPNDVDQAIEKILLAVDSFLGDQPALQGKMHKKILNSLKSKNAAVWCQNSLKLAKSQLNVKNFAVVDPIIKELREYCRLPGSTTQFDPNKSRDLLDTLALEIKMCQLLKNNARMKAAYVETQKLTAVINDPKVVAIIRETGGIIGMSEKKWDAALDDLFESYKNYLEIADARAKTILKYTILASILANSKINLAATLEAKMYAQDKEIMMINDMRSAFEVNDIDAIQRILNSKDSHILDDPIISMYLEDLMRSIRLKVIIARVKPYKTVSLDHLSRQLNVSREDICGLLSELILEERLKGEIDQLNGFLELSMDSKATEGAAGRHAEMRNWAQSLNQVHSQLMAKLSRVGGGGMGAGVYLQGL